MSKHTPGPWRWTERPMTGRKVQILLGGDPPQRIVTPDPRCVAPNSEDAALISAAPDLLAACKRLMELAKELRAEMGGDYGYEDLEAGRAAIDKAEGR